ncbi:BamA/TamA family outer membrane protein [Nostoc sp. UCD121]|uniref:BamA/TamA family outer membrane protein n=1 Tax=unclassified Nostoc TaxID=2593658 RepID=UPI00162812A6|nr:MULTISPECIES: BamA/TamA family outer membrane protein [unclassified Nostoc]MBC1223366.1 BamA/TamA family outer membrane protein [Nostoc sp. UCD120]MBC1278809.1 BamA/TamA family outer membrane protein [Nostoc sp. UCD121]MBC1298646.1 BamA/TamA family outer membrane protein [Nostoc sp. UCD122]
MRVQITVVAIAVMLVGGKNPEALADSQPSTQDGASGIVAPKATIHIEGEYAKYGGYIGVSLGDSQTLEISQKIVKDIQIRFLNSRGLPIRGRTQKDFVIGLLRLKPGQVFSKDLLQADLQRLRRLESFNQVNVYPKEDASSVNILYVIKERSFPSLILGGGNNDDVGLYGRVGYKDENVSGLNDKLDTVLQFSTKDVQFDGQFTSRYRSEEPNRLGYSVRGFRNRNTSGTFNEDIRLADGSKVREGRFGGSVALLRAFDEWDTSVALNYTRISLRDGEYNVVQVDRLGSPLSVSGTGIDDLFTVSFAVSRDQRDRRDNPTQGSILTFSTEQAIPIGLGNISSNRLRGDYIQYFPVSWIGNGKPTDNPEMLAINLQIGTTIGDFPPADAFNIGGIDSVRGYGYGKVASGRSYGLASVEYRFPIFQSIGGVVFTDFASDFGSSETVLGEPGVLRDKPGSGFGYGLGLRLNSPFGLIRGDLGISDQGEVRFEVTTGQRF